MNTSNSIKPTQTRMYREKYTYCIIKSTEHLKNLKTVRVPCLGIGGENVCLLYLKCETFLNYAQGTVHYTYSKRLMQREGQRRECSFLTCHRKCNRKCNRKCILDVYREWQKSLLHALGAINYPNGSS